MTANSTKELSTFSVLIVFLFAIPTSIYLFISYGEILRKSTTYILENHGYLSLIFGLVSLIVFIPFYSIFASFAWSAQQLGPKKLDPSDEKILNKILRFAIYLAAVSFLIFNIVCIYIYISHIRQNPFTENLLINYATGNI